MNALPKYVVSTTLDKTAWNNTHLIKENVVEEIRNLKKQSGRDILVYGSGTLLQTLMQNNLVDQYNLLVYPLVLGEGKRLFKGSFHTTLKLAATKKFDTGVVLLTYRPQD